MIDEKESVDKYSISEKLVGQLYPVLLANDGRRIDGGQRQKANKKWKTVKLKNINTDEKYFVAQILSNTRRNVPKEERKKWFNDLAEIYYQNGILPDGSIVNNVALVVGYSIKTIRKYLDIKYKDSSQNTIKMLIDSNTALYESAVLPLINDNEKINGEPESVGLYDTVIREGIAPKNRESNSDLIISSLLEIDKFSDDQIREISWFKINNVISILEKDIPILSNYLLILRDMKGNDNR